MYKKLLFPCILFLLLAALAGPQVVSAGVDPLASPTPHPTERITAPVISGVNPDAVLSEGNLADSVPSDSFFPAAVWIPAMVDPPNYVELESQKAAQDISLADFSGSFDDVNCGPASLAQALNLLDPDANDQLSRTDQISDFMAARGLMYEWGTGVEELAYAAREFGFEGSMPFHDWSLERLTEYLHQGSPVVVSLGMNGKERPGHFVTLTGISEDGRWISFQDPDRGESILSREEFLSLWQVQGNAGMIPMKGSAGIPTDPMLPWMGLFGAISALALTMKQTAGTRESRVFTQIRKQLANPLRTGIGGGPLPPEEPELSVVPRYETQTVYRGIKTVEVEVPVYATRKIKVGVREVKKEIPQYETRRVQVGVESVTKRVPLYTTRKVKTGVRLVKKEISVTRYRAKTVLVWKKYTNRVPVYKRIGSKRIVVGYKNQTRWKRVPVTKQVPYQTTKMITVQEPEYKESRVISGYKNLTEKVPRFEHKKVLVGHKTVNEIIPVYEERKVQIGTKVVTREMPQYEVVRIPILDRTETFQEPDGSPPTGLSAEIWKSLSVEDQNRFRLDQIDSPETKEEKWWHVFLRKLKEVFLDPINELRDHPDEFLKKIDVEKVPKIVSLSAKRTWDINIFSQEGMVFNTIRPSGLWQLFYMTQKFDIEQKSILTINPGGLINFNYTSGTGSIKISKNLSYIFGPGEWGISLKKDPSCELFDYGLSKHLLSITGKGISYKWQEEDVNILNTKENFQIKVVSTRKCETKTVKFEGILVAIISIYLVYAGAYWYIQLLDNLKQFPMLGGV